MNCQHFGDFLLSKTTEKLLVNKASFNKLVDNFFGRVPRFHKFAFFLRTRLSQYANAAPVEPVSLLIFVHGDERKMIISFCAEKLMGTKTEKKDQANRRGQTTLENLESVIRGIFAERINSSGIKDNKLRGQLDAVVVPDEPLLVARKIFGFKGSRFLGDSQLTDRQSKEQVAERARPVQFDGYVMEEPSMYCLTLLRLMDKRDATKAHLCSTNQPVLFGLKQFACIRSGKMPKLLFCRNHQNRRFVHTSYRSPASIRGDLLHHRLPICGLLRTSYIVSPTPSHALPILNTTAANFFRAGRPSALTIQSSVRASRLAAAANVQGYRPLEPSMDDNRCGQNGCPWNVRRGMQCHTRKAWWHFKCTGLRDDQVSQLANSPDPFV
ncbi:hypothetical protein CSKR_109610 [Clonorchis sinensis]|uniref:Uncharacterized protein n=1 Tax=Clonorchis sinensis TaxID=79923 RepID=A0A3R7CB14_CLOSI|nr:hypothetical protein CSKR_109610 [Clonorchis sinensis]